MPGRAAPPTVAEQELYEALWLRRTDRWPFQYMPIPPQILVEMESAAAHERGWLRLLPPRERRRVVRAVATANRRLRAAMEREQELLNLGETPPTVRRQTQLMGLSTDDDRPLDWLRAGEALQRALLNGTRFSMSAQGGRSVPYRQPLYYAPLDPHQLWRRPATPGGYAVEVSFLTQSLELADLIGLERANEKALEERVDQKALQLADLEAVDPRDLRNRQRREDSRLRWPWHSYFTEIPQVVLQVGYAPVRGAFTPRDPTPDTQSDDDEL